MFPRGFASFLAVLFVSSLGVATAQTAPLAPSSNSSDLVYTALPQPCRVIDTRLSGGRLTSARSFRVAGSVSLAGQGGEAGGCGIPAGVGKASAVMINFVAVNPSGRGNLRASAWPNPVPATGSVINYQWRTVSNAVVFPICDNSVADCANGYDITVLPNGAPTDLVADVVGYFSKFDANSAVPQAAYTTLPEPCRIFDTQLGGAMMPGISRDFVVAGSTGFETQGGTPGGCGIPSGATAAMITFFAVDSDGVGNVKVAAYPQPVPSRGSILNYQARPQRIGENPTIFANSVVVPLCDASSSPCSADLTLQANVSKTNLVGDVVGYFAPAQQQAVGIPPTQQNLLYTTLPQPCRIIDQRNLPFERPWPLLFAYEPKAFKVTGSAGFELQGGMPGGCGVPAEATAAMINFVGVRSVLACELKATRYPSTMPDECLTVEQQCGIPTRGTILQQEGDVRIDGEGSVVAGAVLLPICDAAISTCTSDITLESFGSRSAGSIQVVADVIGYARRVPAQ